MSLFKDEMISVSSLTQHSTDND